VLVIGEHQGQITRCLRRDDESDRVVGVAAEVGVDDEHARAYRATATYVHYGRCAKTTPEFPSKSFPPGDSWVIVSTDQRQLSHADFCDTQALERRWPSRTAQLPEQ
jgi:hypothetical protein